MSNTDLRKTVLITGASSGLRRGGSPTLCGGRTSDDPCGAAAVATRGRRGGNHPEIRHREPDSRDGCGGS